MSDIIARIIEDPIVILIGAIGSILGAIVIYSAAVSYKKIKHFANMLNMYFDEMEGVSLEAPKAANYILHWLSAIQMGITFTAIMFLLLALQFMDGLTPTNAIGYILLFIFFVQTYFLLRIYWMRRNIAFKHFMKSIGEAAKKAAVESQTRDSQ